MNRSKFIAKLTGFISIAICIIYLLLITIFDYRASFNDYFSDLPNNMGVIFLKENSFYCFLFFVLLH